MENSVYVKIYSPPEVDKKEILRYSGMRETTPETEILLEECLNEVLPKLSYKVCYCELPIDISDEYIDFGFSKVSSTDLKKNLGDSESVVFFAATIGLELDRLISRYSTVSPVKALMLQAIGAERIESLSNTFNGEISKLKCSENKSLKPRFSPGYGDLAIEFQKDIFRLLDCPRKIGLMLNESFLMSPSKSVTALIGVSDKSDSGNKEYGCKSCKKTDCEYRKKQIHS